MSAQDDFTNVEHDPLRKRNASFSAPQPPTTTAPPTTNTTSAVPSTPASSNPLTVSSISNTDPVKLFLKEKSFPEKGKPPKAEEVPQNAEGISQLAEQDCWKEVIKLCEKVFTMSYAPHEQIQFKLALVVAFIKLKLFDPAIVQCDSLGNLVTSATYYYQTYPAIYKSTESNQVGNFSPFSLELLQAIIPAYRDNSLKALDQLYRLLHRCSREIIKLSSSGVVPSEHEPPKPVLSPSERVLMMKPKTSKVLAFGTSTPSQPNLKKMDVKKQEHGSTVTPKSRPESLKLSEEEGKLNSLASSQKIDLKTWQAREQRVLFFIINLHIARKEYTVALQLIEKITKYFDNIKEDEAQLEQYTTLISVFGCLYLQAGIVGEATKLFKQIEQLLDFEKLTGGAESTPATMYKIARVYLNRGYLKFAQGQYLAAYEQFQQCMKADPLNITAANNRAICLVYTCNLTKAIDSLEEVIRTDPVKTLDETLLYNLFTLYDLEGEQAGQKKRVIQQLVSRFKGEEVSAVIAAQLKV